MATQKELKRLMSNPATMMQFQATGRLPSSVRPDSPLIRLLEKISPRDRVDILQVTIDESLGYTGTVTFGSAEQALRWLKPSDQVSGSFPAETRRIKTFTADIPFSKFASNCGTVPQSVIREFDTPHRGRRP